MLRIRLVGCARLDYQAKQSSKTTLLLVQHMLKKELPH